MFSNPFGKPYRFEQYKFHSKHHQHILSSTNPFAIDFVKKSSDLSSDLEITLLSLTGQTILQTTLAAGEVSITISVAHLPAGVYLCRWQEVGGGASGVVKVAVIR